MITRLLVLLLVLLAMHGCAGPQSSASSSGRAASSPRVRCLSDPHETGTRPLIFLMCIESP
jgi:hypothetical protein